MEETVVFKFVVFEGSIKHKAMMVFSEFPGITSVKDFKEGGKVKVIGDFNKLEMKEKLEKIDETVVIIEDEEKNKPQPQRLQKANNQPISKREESKPFDIGSLNLPAVQPYKIWERAKDVGAGVVGYMNKEKVNEPKPVLDPRRAFNYGEIDYKKQQPPLMDRAKGFLAGVGKLIKKEEVNNDHLRCQRMGPGDRWNWTKGVVERKPSEASSSSTMPAQNSEGVTQGYTESILTNLQSALSSTVQGTASALSTVRGTASTHDPRTSTQTTRYKESRSDAKQGKKGGT